MSDVLARWNEMNAPEAAEEILPCCGSQKWAQGMAARRPVRSETALLAACDEICEALSESDWDEAFRNHPRIGESAAAAASHARSAGWSGEEQKKASIATDDFKTALAEENSRYENRFGRIFIVCATGKTATEILEILRRRLKNDESTELREAAEEQRRIAHLRLKKWLAT
jgi:2-oxo-4-hydroxy-4-carboxy-5-ureidoimidazoline decarboxylase